MPWCGTWHSVGDDYLSQLALLTLADLHRHSRPESGRSILSGLLARAAIDQQEEETAMRLWQARLVLKLGELFDAEQAGLEEALQAMDRRQENLLKDCAKKQTSCSLDGQPAGGRPADRGDAAHRLKAWSRMFFHRPSQPTPALFVTAHPAAMDTLGIATKRSSGRARSTWSVWSCPPPTARPRCRPRRSSTPVRFCARPCWPPTGRTGPRACARGGGLGAPLDEVFVQAEDRSRLDLFAFPGMSARQLFLAAYAGERTGPGQADPPGPPPTLVGTLTAR